MFNRIHSVVLLIASLALPSAAQAEVPPYMQYQGYLTSMADEPISGFFTMTFGLYREAEGGEPVWSEEREGVEVAAGRFAVRLGDRTPIDGAVFGLGQLYLQVSVEGDTLEPREAVSTVAHAFHAGVAENVVGDITPRTVSVGGQPVIDENGRWVGEIAGLQGPQGERGEVGPQGPQGETGAQGVPGERGVQGSQGDPGVRGDRGPAGDRGSQGDRGVQGIRGADGARGLTGETGSQGEPGARGLAGLQGDQGDPGARGLPGAQGAQGERGLIGPMPAHEWNGSQLRFRDAVDSWGDYVDLRGPQGIQGEPGATGATGAQGERGPAGELNGTCGDDAVSPWEECDDGNTADHDGCSSRCKAELTAVSVSFNQSSACALRGDGRVFCWGSNNGGQLGDGSRVERRYYTSPVVGITTAIDIAISGHACAVLSNSTVKCWGSNGQGQVGDGTRDTDRLLPTTVLGLTGATQIANGDSHSCARLSNGRVKCWGYNPYGQLGDGSTTVRTSPVSVSNLTTVSKVEAGQDNTCALKDDGTVWCWGNLEGVRNYGTAPEQIPGLANVTSLAIGYNHSCALRSGGSVQCWGVGNYGQLGDSNTVDRYPPVVVSNMVDAETVSVGWNHTCVTTTAKRLSCWGRGSDYRLLQRSTTSYSTPQTSDLVSGALSVAAGYAFTCVRTATEVVCGGSNSHGQITGSDNVVQRPQSISGLVNR